MLDDLRRAAQSKEGAFTESPVQAHAEDDRLFGMTALERMFLSIGLFGVVLVVSVMLLLVTNSIAF